MSLSFLFLAQTMVDLGKGMGERSSFSTAMDDQLAEFEFPEDFVTDVWTFITAREP